ncbi:MAG: hypothetical protein ACK4TO_08335 [Candidatus Nitrosotenuis sp.]
MSYPLSSEKDGIKIIPHLMEPEKMYYCLHNEKILLVFKDAQEFLNCYEVEEKEIVENVKNCKNPEEIEKVIENYLKNAKSQT